MRPLYAPFNRNHDRMLVMDVRSRRVHQVRRQRHAGHPHQLHERAGPPGRAVGADIELVRQGIGSDPRIGYSFLYAGAGYGGSAFPKDVQALIRTARDYGQTLRVLDAVEAVNDEQKTVLVDKIVDALRRRPAAARRSRCGAWPSSPTPTTCARRRAACVIGALLRAGARIVAHDPVAVDEARRVLQLDFADAPELAERIGDAQQPMQALAGADALVIVTEWKAFRSPDFDAIKAQMKQPLVFDGRNLYEPLTMREAGVELLRHRPQQPVTFFTHFMPCATTTPPSASWSPAAPVFSARTCASGCSRRATTCCASTTSSPAPSATSRTCSTTRASS